MTQELKFTTVTGKSLDEVRKLLDAPLPEEAYKKIGGTAMDLTDISPAWTRRALTSIFGLYGFGWGMNHDGADVELTFETKANGKTAADVALKRAKFWYVLLNAKGEPQVFSFTCTGSGRNEQGNGGWALKGAMTNALSTAASFIGFQESVYMGKRSHHDTTAKAPVSGMSIDPAKTITTQTPAVPDADPTPASVPTVPGLPEASAASAPSVTPPTNPVTPPPAEKPLLHFACDGCGHPISEYARPDKCPKCGNGCLRSFPTLAAAKRHTPSIPQEPATPAAEPTPQPCMSCGSIVPVTPTCPDCNGETIATDTRALTDEMNRLSNKNRAVLLRRASKVAGRAIKGYAEMALDDLRALVYDLRLSPPTAEESKPAAPAVPTTPKPPAAPPVPPVAPPAAGGNGQVSGPTAGATGAPAKLSKVQLIQEIFRAAGAIGMSTPASIMGELSTRWKRTITSTAELSIEELETSLREFRGVKP